jgi:hypothetical protein
MSRRGTTADLKLMKTDNIASQLTNAERLPSMPGRLAEGVPGLHQPPFSERIVTSAHTTESRADAVPRMGTYSPRSMP